MAHYKNRKPKSYRGCCGMCAMQTHPGGRCKRLPAMDEQKATSVEEGLSDCDTRNGRTVMFAEDMYSPCENGDCEVCFPIYDDDSDFGYEDPGWSVTFIDLMR